MSRLNSGGAVKSADLPAVAPSKKTTAVTDARLMGIQNAVPARPTVNRFAGKPFRVLRIVF
jgi:hypothetical protein